MTTIETIKKSLGIGHRLTVQTKSGPLILSNPAQIDMHPLHASDARCKGWGVTSFRGRDEGGKLYVTPAGMRALLAQARTAIADDPDGEKARAARKAAMSRMMNS